MSVTPLHVGVEAVASGAALVLIPQMLLRGLFPLTVDLHDALGAECHICMDKDLQAVRCVLQNVIRAAAHNDAGPFCASSVMTLYTIAYKLSPDSAKKACGCSATGFTQKRHTLYAYYSRGETEFQMVFCLSSPAASPALPICLRNYYNQKIHDNLNRNQASAFLHQWVGNMNPLPVETIE